MIYKIKNDYYMLMQSDQDNLHLQRISDGRDLIVSYDELNFMKPEQVDIKTALSYFYDAQWIGKKDPEKMTIALMQEASEALNELDWKPWKTKQPDIEAYKKELADIGIFLLVCARTVDMTLDDLLYEMFHKHVLNFKRKDHNKRD